jgi:hypothetical protein
MRNLCVTAVAVRVGGPGTSEVAAPYARLNFSVFQSELVSISEISQNFKSLNLEMQLYSNLQTEPLLIWCTASASADPGGFPALTENKIK